MRNSFKVTFAIVPDHSADLPYIKSSSSRAIWISLILNTMRKNSFPFSSSHKIFFFWKVIFFWKESLSYPQQYISEASMCMMYFHRILSLFYLGQKVLLLCFWAHRLRRVSSSEGWAAWNKATPTLSHCCCCSQHTYSRLKQFLFKWSRGRNLTQLLK